MALTITKLKMWKDPGYTRNCLEVPPAGSKKLPAVPDYTLTADETLRPHKGSTLTELHLPLSFTQTFGMSYLYIEATDGAGSVSLFGWITSIEQRSSSAEGVTIRWDVDWWRSYSDQITWGSGNVTRCSDNLFARPYQTHPRFWNVAKYKKLHQVSIDTTQTPPVPFAFCVILTYNYTTPTNETLIRTIFWDASSYNAEYIEIGGFSYKGVDIDDIFNGLIDERLGIDPNDIISVFLSPITPWYKDASNVITNTGTDNVRYFAYVKGGNQIYPCTFNLGVGDIYESNDMLKTVIIDPYGSIVYTLPWGYMTNKIDLWIDSGTTGCNVVVDLNTSANASQQELAASGRKGTIPCIEAPINSNAYSSYVYSGQRDYDREMKNIQRDQQTVANVTGIANSAIGGGIAGAGGGPLGAAAGAAMGSITGVTGTVVDWISAGIFNDRINDETDKLYSNQASNVIQSAGGMGFYNSVGGWYIVQLEADSHSEAEYTAKIARDGYSTDFIISSISTYVTGGGPLQVRSLNITGNAPPQAKQFIKTKLENGVYIVENNPSGVAP